MGQDEEAEVEFRDGLCVCIESVCLGLYTLSEFVILQFRSDVTQPDAT